MVVHLMIAGRFRWRDGRADSRQGWPGGVRFPGGHAAADRGRLEAPGVDPPRARRAAAWPSSSAAASRSWTRTSPAFAERLTRENHTLKRALTDPHIFSGIGNAYSDEILHAARLSPMKLTRTLSDDEIARLFDATQRTLEAWIERTRDEVGGGFPEKVTAFREGMAVARPLRQALSRPAAPPSSASSTPTTSATTARPARPRGACSRTARSRAS